MFVCNSQKYEVVKVNSRAYSPGKQKQSFGSGYPPSKRQCPPPPPGLSLCAIPMHTLHNKHVLYFYFSYSFVYYCNFGKSGKPATIFVTTQKKKKHTIHSVMALPCKIQNIHTNRGIGLVNGDIYIFQGWHLRERVVGFIIWS